jgi:TolB-like protein
MLFPSDILTPVERGGESGGFATTDKELLESWKEIGAHLRRSPKTCRRWAHELGLPVHRLDGSPKARVFAYSEELDRWKADKLKEGNPHLLANDGPSAGHEAVRESLPATAEASSEPSAASRVVMTASGRKTIAFVAATVTVAAAAVLFLWKPWARGISPLSPSGHPNLAVLYFENISRDRGLDDWITGIPQLLMTDLNQSRFISLLSYDEVYGILLALGLKDVQKYSSADLARIARQGRATHTITGSILKAGDKIILTLVSSRGGLQRLRRL